MKIVLLTLFILNIVLMKPSVQASNNILKVSLYYEALCPYCLRFIQQQLYPTYKKIGSALSLEFIPYGNVRRYMENGSWVFQCQHGVDECAINKIEACGLARSDDQDKQLEFVSCIEHDAAANRKDLKKLAQCASRLGLSGNEILKCAQGSEGNNLFAKLADKQEVLYPPVTYVPWLIFNNQTHNESLENNATENFFKTVCALLSDKPEGCSQFNQIPTYDIGVFGNYL